MFLDFRKMAVTAVLFCVAFTVVTLAQNDVEVVPQITSVADMIVYFIPILVPILIALTKKWLYIEQVLADGTIKLEPPAWFPKWSIPIIAPLLGMLVSWLFSLAGAGDIPVLNAALLGAAGTWLRELTKPLTNK